ncbi:gamma-glutamyl-gamma-aminobutyrate hydrolase family protein [Alcanivorax sp. JB21]|uniref:gamma-glutamyl-gamma-aminobutyrate hydrolase family protein n=1 Tax=Alcanivorax limicola TaxID=2874102 RepID=UPI001CBAB6A7|nr:gamma-glutamyl-gamma-aminobutyrate hydrolase family protein [Alcanivorax limicola]MBZ2188438.1 gamma-glutamyl-gamma-aminobutyrate hydrolase family protein [Alcanivorax limicola]
MVDVADKPLIGVAGPTRHLFDIRLIRLALHALGADSVHLHPGMDRPPAPPARQIDGLVIAGGDHVHPRHYQQLPQVKAAYNPGRDTLELALLDEARERSLPVMGICRGAQLLNVHRGGDLHQNITPMRRHTRPRRLITAAQPVRLVPRSRLSRVLRRRRLGANRMHSQSIRELGEGLRVAARDADHFVQAIENEGPGQWQLGVQWHPEYLLYHPAHRQLFRALVEAARRRKTQGKVDLTRR